MIVRIKRGALISQDFRVRRWPECFPPRSEYDADKYKPEAKDPDMEFDATWNGRFWTCKADGYGSGEYGNGSIFVTGYDGVDLPPA